MVVKTDTKRASVRLTGCRVSSHHVADVRRANDRARRREHRPPVHRHRTTIVVHRPRVYASAIEWTSYLRGSILLLLPRIGWLRCLRQRGDHGALLVGLAELRARALRHVLRDEQQSWVELATAHVCRFLWCHTSTVIGGGARPTGLAEHVRAVRAPRLIRRLVAASE